MTAMKPPRPIVTYELETGNAVRHASIHAVLKALATNESYARNRINDGKPCKGFLLYDLQHAYTGDTIAHVRKLSQAFDAAFKARSKQPDHEISVRIDPRTVILVKASKWTPDYAERYKARMEASKPHPHSNYGDWMREKNDSIKPKTPKRGPGRPRKAVA